MNAARRLAVATLCALAGGLVLWSAPASAAPPEAPGPVAVESVKATEATFNGVLNPGKEGASGTYELGTYEFLYKKSNATCEGEGKAPASPGISLGGGKEGVSQSVTGLQAGTEYTVCLLARNGVKGETVVGPAVHFTTAIPVEAPEGAAASGVTATTAVLHGVLNPHSKREAEPGSWEFRYRQSAGECEGEHEEATPSVVAAGHEGEAVQAAVSGLLPGATYTFCLRASNKAGEEAVGPPETFTAAAAPPTIGEESVLDVAATSASFAALIDPNGEETTYRFEYGTSVAYGSSVPVPDGLVGSGSTPLTVSAHPQDLSPGTEYHYRVVALVASRGEAIPGADGTFTTQPVGSEFLLPDGRQWELVSQPNKHGALLASLHFSEGELQASEDGSAIAYRANVPTELGPPGYVTQEQVISRREAEGWSSHDISSPHSESTTLDGAFAEYKLFSADLSEAFTEPAHGLHELLSSEASEQTFYLRREGLCGASATAGECFLPLVTGKEGFADVPPGTEWKYGEGTLALAGASPDLRHVVIDSNVQLTGTPLPPGHGTEEYEWSAGVPAKEALQLVSVLPASEGGGAFPGSGGTVGAPDFSGAYTGYRHAVSDDGSRVFWGNENLGGAENAMYVYDALTRKSVRLDVPQPGAPPPSNTENSVIFQFANGEGTKVFFTEGNRKLTAQSGGGRGPDLYECEIVEEAGESACRLTDLTPESGGQSAEVQRMLLGASEDGSYVYFVANGLLGDAAERGATRGTCVAGVGGQNPAPGAMCNLYEYHAGRVTFIATLSSEDAMDWGMAGDAPSLGNVTARVSPDGRYLAFMSNRSLTGYDNRDAVSGKPDQEVYLYDTQRERLVCVSCDPTGSRPTGVEMWTTQNPANVADVGRQDFSVAANLPGGDDIGSGEALYQPRLLFDGGRLFFNSSDALVPQDINGQEDVYEYEPEGFTNEEGKVECTASSVTFSAKSGGCVSLISSGTSPEESGFLDASVNGSDVFFLTESRLVPQDYDTAYDVYDAHECSSTVPCVAAPVSSPPCDSGDSCKAAPTPQPTIFGAPASATFSGAGNVAPSSPPVVAGKSLTRAQRLARALKACRGKPRRRRAACERQARRQYGKAARRAARASGKVGG